MGKTRSGRAHCFKQSSKSETLIKSRTVTVSKDRKPRKSVALRFVAYDRCCKLKVLMANVLSKVPFKILGKNIIRLFGRTLLIKICCVDSVRLQTCYDQRIRLKRVCFDADDKISARSRHSSTPTAPFSTT